MRRNFFLLLMAFLFASLSDIKAMGYADNLSDDIRVGSLWHNGMEWFQVRRDGNVLVFFGGTLHEGGSVFGLVPQGGNSYKVVMAKWDNDPELDAEPMLSARGVLGLSPQDLSAELRNVDGNDAIIVRHKTKGVRMVLLPAGNAGFEALGRYIESGLAQWMAGHWQSQYGQQFLLTTEKNYSFPTGSGTYEIETMYDTPTNIITLDDGTHWQVIVENESMTLTPFKLDDESEDWVEVPGGGVIHTTLASEDQQQWRYPFASTQVLTPGLLDYYEKSELRVMRNEIMARHGYKFNSADLQKRFSKVKDYKPLGNNAQVKLSALEQLNVEIIKSMEETDEMW